MPQPTLRTTRLTLEPVDEQALDELHRLWADPQVRRYLFDDQPVTRQLAAAVLEDCLTGSAKGHGLWLVRLSGAPLVVGCAGLLPTTVAAQFEPQLRGLLEPLAALHPSSWHQGYATEALAALRDYAFARLGVAELAAVHDVPNEASGRMLQRLGFTVLSRVAGPRHEMQTYRLVSS